MRARLIGSNIIIDVTKCGYQDLGGMYYDCPAHKCYYREDRLDFNVSEDSPISVSPSIESAALDYSRNQTLSETSKTMTSLPEPNTYSNFHSLNDAMKQSENGL